RSPGRLSVRSTSIPVSCRAPDASASNCRTRMLGGKLGQGAGLTPMSVESKRLRDRAAQQLRAGRQAKDRTQKTIHEDRAASFKEMAHNEEWLSGDRQRSRVIAQLSVKQCMEEARRCRALARKV